MAVSSLSESSCVYSDVSVERFLFSAGGSGSMVPRVDYNRYFIRWLVGTLHKLGVCYMLFR